MWSVLLVLFSSLLSGVIATDLVEYTRGHTILCVGDSLTHGLYVTPDDTSGDSSHSYTLQLTKSLKEGATVVEAGVNGATLTDMLKAQPYLLKQHNPLLVIILGGSNDLNHGGQNATYERMMHHLAQLHKMSLSYVRSDKLKVITIAITIPPFDGHDEDKESTRIRVNTGIAKLTKHHPRTFVCDLAAQAQFSFANKYSPFWSSDGLHLSSTGYDVLAEVRPLMGLLKNYSVLNVT